MSYAVTAAAARYSRCSMKGNSAPKGTFLLQCSMGNKWDAVQTELPNSLQASDASGSYQLTFHMYVE